MPETTTEERTDFEILEALTWDPVTPCEIQWGDGSDCGEKAVAVIRCRHCRVSYFISAPCSKRIFAGSQPGVLIQCRCCGFPARSVDAVFELVPLGGAS